MRYLKSINPYNLEELSSVPELEDAAIDSSLKLAGEAFHKFRNSGFSYRTERMITVASILLKRKTELAKLITAEMGKLIRESESEVEKCAWVCEYYAAHAEEFLSGRVEESDADESRVICQPVGTVLAVMPWNFPFWQVFRFAAPALMAGNTALLKHASNVQGCGRAIEKVFLDAGFEPGVFQNLAISSSKVSQLIASPVVKAVTLTGSGEAGSSVASQAGKHLKKCLLELGGNNAFVVLNDADIDLAVDVAIKARLLNSGQSCIAAKRFILEKGIHDLFVDKLKKKLSTLSTGDPSNAETDIAPLFSPGQADEVKKQVLSSLKMGAKLICGGEKDQSFYAPAILTNVKPGMAVFSEETFGPVFAVTKATDLKDALRLSNTSEFGLGIQVFTTSSEAAELFIREADEGSVFINGMVKSDPRLPFGGVKKSGFGRELSKEGILEFVNIKTVWKKN